MLQKKCLGQDKISDSPYEVAKMPEPETLFRQEELISPRERLLGSPCSEDRCWFSTLFSWP